MKTSTAAATPVPLPFRAAAIELRPLASLKPRANNPRKHSDKQIAQIAASIQEFGFTTPLLVDADDCVVAGHGRLEAAKRLGMTEVPTLRLSHLSPAQLRAYVIADNKLAENASWDKELLRIELQELIDLQFDVEIIGFETAEIDLLTPTGSTADEAPLPDDLPAVSTLGDLWLLGDHRLLCGDAMKAESYAALLGDDKAQMVFTDPPYNVRVDGHVSVAGNARHGEFAMASGEMSEAQFTTFLRSVCEQLTAFSIDGSIHFICMDWRHMRELLAGAAGYAELKNLCVWNKDNGGMGSLYRSKHELVFVFKHGKAKHINNVELGKHGRNRTNVWDYPGATSMGKSRLQDLAMHPTVKPVAMIADAMRDCSKRRGLVLDPFGGSGSTLMAAQETGRRAALIELDPKYVAVTIARYERLTGRQAVHAGSKATFAQVKAERREGSARATATTTEADSAEEVEHAEEV